jgi:L-amino acid N-acyltransferase YncA
VREATEADWLAIFPIFDAVVAAGETYAYPEGLSSAEARSVWMLPPPSRVVVAVEDRPDGSEHVLGTATMGPNRPGRGSHVGTASFMVDAAARGRGVGRALGEHVVAWHRDQGFHAIQFNAVVETNAAAVALWHRLGFRTIGTVPEAFRHRVHGLVGLHVMWLPLRGGDAALGSASG